MRAKIANTLVYGNIPAFTSHEFRLAKCSANAVPMFGRRHGLLIDLVLVECARYASGRTSADAGVANGS